MSITNDVRSYADAAVEQGKTALAQAGSILTTANKRLVADAPKPAYAWIGAADLVAESLGKRVEALPAEAVTGLAKAQDSGKARLVKVQQDAVAKVVELRSLVEAGVESAKELGTSDLPSRVKETAEGYLTLAGNLYESLSARGEDKLVELLKDPRVGKLVSEASHAADAAEGRVRPVVNSVIGSAKYTAKSVDSALNRSAEASTAPAPVKRSATKSRPSTAGTKAPATKAPAKKVAAKKAPAKSPTQAAATPAAPSASA